MVYCEVKTCPGLFYSTKAQDGNLLRLRLPAGIINSEQCRLVSKIARDYGNNTINITNRANLQLRGIKKDLPIEILSELQNIGLGSKVVEIDPLRNIMASPTAGIDRYSIIDTRPLVKAWDDYLNLHPELSHLSPKFSIGFDGGEGISINSRLNDISLIAQKGEVGVEFDLCLSFGESKTEPKPVGVKVKPQQCISLLGAAAGVYAESVNKYDRPLIRLRQLLNNYGVQWFLTEIEKRLNFPLKYSEPKVTESTNKWLHIGIHQQSQADLFYVGLVIPLGQISTDHLDILANLADSDGNGELNLTPWQNIILTNISQNKLSELVSKLTQLDLNFDLNNPFAGIVVCSGKNGCKSAYIDTHQQADQLVEIIKKQTTIKTPITIHISGCHKSCAEHNPCDITLIGVESPIEEKYDLYGLKQKILTGVDRQEINKYISQINFPLSTS